MKKTETIEKKKKNRIWEIDFLRGVLIIGMVIDHFMFYSGNLVPGLFGGPNNLPTWLANYSNFCSAYWVHPAKLAVRYIGLILFFVLIGISSRFSRSNLKRGLITLGLGIGLSLILMTYSLISKNNYYALFPIISCLGVSMLLYWGVNAIYKKFKKEDFSNWKWWSLIIGLCLFIGTVVMNLLRSTVPLQFGNIFLTIMGYNAPGPWDSNTPLQPSEIFNVIIGASKWGNDWLGLLPYCAFTFIGGFIGEHFYQEKKSLFFRTKPEKNVAFNEKALKKTSLINWLGKKTLFVYILHPIILVPILVIFFSIGAGRWPF